MLNLQTFDPRLDENVIRKISAKKNEPEFLLEWRLDRHIRQWLKMERRHGLSKLPEIRLSTPSVLLKSEKPENCA